MSVETMSLVKEEKKTVYRASQLSRLDLKRVPGHIAIIPDGNRRWAKKRQSTTQEGHREGADVLMTIVRAAKELGVRTLTFYAFSTENWERPEIEVQALMSLIASYLVVEIDDMVQNGIKFDTIGDIEQVPDFLQQAINDAKEATRNCQEINLVLALNYGARDEMRRAVVKMIKDYSLNRLRLENISERTISGYLDTKNWQDPDLLIRAGGELRVSNFLLWQLSYTEIHSAPVYWPDFNPLHLLEAIIDYQKRDRRLGGGE